jgi:thermitase
MTYSLVIVAGILGTWVIFHNNKTFGPTLNKMALLALLFQVIFRYISSFNTELALFSLAKDAFILSCISALLIISKKNIFAQLGILFASIYFLSSQVNSFQIEKPNQEIDKEWELLVKTKDGTIGNNLRSLCDHYGIQIQSAFQPQDAYNTELDNFYSIGIPDNKEKQAVNIVKEINSLSETEWVEYNEKLYRLPLEPGKIVAGKTLKSVNDPLTSQQWSLQALNMEDYYNTIKNENLSPTRKAKLFILDSGIFSDHEDLKGVYVKSKAKHEKDGRGHGTHCAGIAAAVSNNNTGIASMIPGKEWVELHSVKVINDYGFGTQKSIIDGIIEAVDRGADVINMSLGAKSYQSKEKAYEEAIDYATSHNTIVVVAAGNSNDSSKDYVPAKLDDVITVTAIDNTLNRAFFSNYLGGVRYGISAPGVDILSTYNDGNYQNFSGTSMASPHVAGLVTVMKAINPKLSVSEIHQILEQSGTDTGATSETGKLIQPANAISLMLKDTYANK